jgi:hypothetical protein
MGRVPRLVGPGSAARHFAPHRVRDTGIWRIRPVYRHFRGEEFSLWRPWASNKTTAICGQNNGDIAIFAAVSTRRGGEATFKPCAGSFRGIKVPLAPQECSSCSKQFFYSGARRRGSADVLPNSLRSPPPPCGMLASDQATPVCAVARAFSVLIESEPKV